jgi:hypothetical protein
MNTVARLQELSLRIDQLESSGDWLAQVLEDRDDAAHQTANLISTLADDIRFRLLDLVTELEKQIVISSRTLSN